MKCRRRLLRGEVAERVRELIREICKAKDVEIIRGHVSRDDVHKANGVRYGTMIPLNNLWISGSETQ